MAAKLLKMTNIYIPQKKKKGICLNCYVKLDVLVSSRSLIR